MPEYEPSPALTLPELPNNTEAEAALLGCVLAENGWLDRLPHLATGHFFAPVHQRLFDAILRTRQGGVEANAQTLREQFARDEDLTPVGGAGYLVKLTGAALGVANPPGQAAYIVSLAKRRELILGCLEAVRLAATDFEQPPEEIAARVGATVDAVAAEADAMRVLDNYEVTERIIEDLKSRKAPTPTGLPVLDAAMGGGLYAGRSYGFAARKKVGKTVMASTISFNLNQRGVRHLFICGEMGPQEIHERCLARALNVYPSVFRGSDRDAPWFLSRIAEHITRENRCVFYQNAPGLTFDKLRRYVSAAIHRHRVQGVILDYWQLVGGKPRSKSTAEHLDEVAQWIADFCREHGLWSVTMAQINQEGNTRGGEGIRLAFDQVYELIREDETMPQAWLKMLDTRYTPWMNVGSKERPGLYMNERGPFFEQL